MNFEPDKWNAEAENIVFHGCLLKFTQNATARGSLLATGDSGIEQMNPNDPTWSAPGKNLLGNILMRVREHFWGSMLI
ncbi:MAG: hypothetical protein CBC12_07460 [Candidatus Puniceispirillum sp. TMED52]|nr:MAG: hypothetical protein CBC12_07460 [Candidatus Puniceispirillum sp. TMED52]RPF82059.1 MAG: DUF1768 domain-containing protein [Rhodothermaceae bacterium TMED105]